MTLFEPLSFPSGLVLRNRLLVAPMTNLQSHADGSLSEEELAWLVARARGGFGAVETCAAHVSKEGQGWPGELGVFEDRLVPGLTRLASALHAEGASAILQIFHGGLRADSEASGLPRWSASDSPEARAGTEADIEGVIEAFGRAAKRAEDAGFDGVEIHGAHGYLLTQFLSVTQNRRVDAWGGALENRARLLLRVLAEVKRQTSPSFTVGVRISPENFGNAEGLDLDESLEVARWLVAGGIDFLHVSLWDATLNTRKRPSEHPIPLFRAAIGERVRLIAAGKVWTRDDAEKLVELGADGIALGRAAILNPSWPNDARSSDFVPRRPPVTIAELRELAVSERFAEYMRRWKGFVV